MLRKILPEPYLVIHVENLLLMLLSLALSFVKFCRPLLRNFSCSQDQDDAHPTYTCCFYTGSTQKPAFHVHQINTPCYKFDHSLVFFPKETWDMQKYKKIWTHESPSIEKMMST